MRPRVLSVAVAFILVLFWAPGAFSAPPPNDSFASATAITTDSFVETVDISEATTEPGEPPVACYFLGGDRTIWYSFTPPTDGLVRATIDSAAYEPARIQSFTGASIDSLALVQCTTFWGAPTAQEFRVTAGTTYYFQASNISANSVTFGFSFARDYSVVPNDDFAAARDVTDLPFANVVDNTQTDTEQGEPAACGSIYNTVWYAYAPPVDQVISVDTRNSGFAQPQVAVWQQTGSGFAGLNLLACVFSGANIRMHPGTTYYLQAGSSAFGSSGDLAVNVGQVPPPLNDAFATAKQLTSLPYSESVDATGATIESGEPSPSCTTPYYGPPHATVWYAFTPSRAGSYMATSYGSAAVYAGGGLADLHEVACYVGNPLTFAAAANVTYFIQVDDFHWTTGGEFTLDVAPPPSISFATSPSDPTIFDTIDFANYSYDPGSLGITSWLWRFGDGTTSADYQPQHRFAADGDYNVQLTATTADGRTNSTTNALHIVTHDVAILEFSTPTKGRVGRASPITVGVANTRYPETVQVSLYKKTPHGTDLVGTLTNAVPVAAKKKTTTFSLSYVFTNDDLAVGKLSFEATAAIQGTRDALPADNTATAPPTAVTR